jgi:S-adenosylmethionine:tRNA ribosyltransferase-isomerase
VLLNGRDYKTLTEQEKTGGKVEALYIRQSGGLIQVLANKKLSSDQEFLLTDGRILKETFKVFKKNKGIYYLKPNFPTSEILSLISKHGFTPLPPYIKHSKLTEKQRREAYQTIFAKTGESVAAPTASLHFTERLLNKLRKKSIAIKFVRLDVNLGTFAKLTEEQIKTGKLHKENYYIDAKTANYITKAKKQGRPIIAVGTTVTRTLESFAKNNKLSGSTDLFIQPGFKFKLIDGMITNFHVPKSSLMMLVSALTEKEKLLKLYSLAIEKEFRFFSFGDGMLVL